MSTFLQNPPPDPNDDDTDVIEMCDVEIHGTCNRCDHPCPAYFLHQAWFEAPDPWFERETVEEWPDDWDDYDYTEGDIGQDGEI